MRRWPNDPLAPATEFIFDISSDRKTTCAVSVFLAPQVVESFVTTHGRTLSEPEQYAAVKLRLLQALDEITDMLHHGRRLTLDAEVLPALLESVGIE